MQKKVLQKKYRGRKNGTSEKSKSSTPRVTYNIGKYVPLIKWYGKTGLLKLSERIVVEISLSTNGTHGQYEGYKVVINSIGGTITSHYFPFNQYFKLSEYDKDRSSFGFEISENLCQHSGVAKWSCNISPSAKEIVAMVDKILEYCLTFENLK